MAGRMWGPWFTVLGGCPAPLGLAAPARLVTGQICRGCAACKQVSAGCDCLSAAFAFAA